MRRMGWTPTDPIHCPVCGGRLDGHVTLLAHGGMRCRCWVKTDAKQCGSTLYVLPVSKLGVAFVAEVRGDELRHVARAELTVWQTLQFLGAGFP